MEWALALAAMLAVVAVVFVARPFLRDPSPASDRLAELAPQARRRLVSLCLGSAAFGAAIGLFAAGSWVWVIVMLLLAGIVLAALGEATRRAGDAWAQHSSRLAADGRAHAATAAEVWRTRLDTAL